MIKREFDPQVLTIPQEAAAVIEAHQWPCPSEPPPREEEPADVPLWCLACGQYSGGEPCTCTGRPPQPCCNPVAETCCNGHPKHHHPAAEAEVVIVDEVQRYLRHPAPAAVKAQVIQGLRQLIEAGRALSHPGEEGPCA